LIIINNYYILHHQLGQYSMHSHTCTLADKGLKNTIGNSIMVHNTGIIFDTCAACVYVLKGKFSKLSVLVPKLLKLHGASKELFLLCTMIQVTLSY